MHYSKYDELNSKIKPSADLAYWVGVAQTDGYLKKQYVKRVKITRYYVKVGVVTSLPMIKKFRKISKNKLFRSNSLFKDKRGYTHFQISVKRLLPVFEKLDINFSDPPKPPIWCLENLQFFGAYLAGVIDGDGDVRIKRPEYPQCAIRICSSKPQYELQKAVNKIFCCSSNIIRDQRWKLMPQGKYYFLTAYNFEFLVSRKNYFLVSKFIVPNMAMPHKRKKLIKFIKRRPLSGFEPETRDPQSRMLPMCRASTECPSTLQRP